MFTGNPNRLSSATDADEINMTVAMLTTFGKEISLDLNTKNPTEGKLTANAQGWTISTQ